MSDETPKEIIPAQRKTAILRLLEEKGSVTIKELEELFDVSHMTIHRDLNALAGLGELKKVRGGAVPGGGQEARNATLERRCELCGMRIPPRTEVIVNFRDKTQLLGCCAHCGLLIVGDGSRVESALGRDFLYGRMTSLFEAAYLIDSDVRPCCMPSTLCFATAMEAHRFQQGFGGEVFNFKAAQRRLAQKNPRESARDEL